MPKLSCWSCGRQIYTVAPLEALFAEERRCPRCGAFLNNERREAERRVRHRRVNPADDPGPPKPKGKPKVGVTGKPAKSTKGSTTTAKKTETKAEPLSPAERRLAERRTARRRGTAKTPPGAAGSGQG